MFDITKIRANDTADVELINGDGTPLVDGKKKLSITVYGPGSEQWQEADAERGRVRMAAMDKKLDKGEMMQKMQQIELKFLADITVSINHFTYPGEYKGVCDMALALYADNKLGFIRDQVAAKSSDWSAFTTGSATS